MSDARRPFLTAEWRYLVMLNYAIEPDVLRPLLPAGTTLDLWQGRALVSVVGFRVLDTRVRGAAIPFHRDFDEVNLRFYVRRQAPGGEVRRGVVFVRELVPRAAIALLGRAVYHEPYRAVSMRSSVPAARVEAPGRLAYEWRTAGRWQLLEATAVGVPSVPAPESEARFITEHHWGYGRDRDEGTVEYAVEHPSWRVWTGATPALVADVAGLYGEAFAPALSGAPASAFIAEGSRVVVSAPSRLAPAVNTGPAGAGPGPA